MVSSSGLAPNAGPGSSRLKTPVGRSHRATGAGAAQQSTQRALRRTSEDRLSLKAPAHHDGYWATGHPWASRLQGSTLGVAGTTGSAWHSSNWIPCRTSDPLRDFENTTP